MMLVSTATAALLAAAWWWRLLRRGQFRAAARPRLPDRWSAVVVVAAVAAAAVAGIRQPGWLQAVCDGAAAAGGCVLAWTDLDEHRIPNRITAWWAVAIAATAIPAAFIAAGWLGVAAVAGAVGVVGVAYLVLALVSPMGMGDVKMAAIMAAAVCARCGLAGVWMWQVIALLGAGVVAGVWLAIRHDRNARVPLAPAFLGGWLAAALLVPHATI